MNTSPPLLFQWNAADDTMRCLSKRGGSYFQDGERYILEAREERSSASHRRFFASIHEAWKTLPEGVDKRFPSSEHLRKWALCKSGFADEEVISCDSADDAKKIASFARKHDDFAVITVRGKIVSIYTAKSQSQRGMNKEEFKASVEGVERVIAELIGTTQGELRSASS